MIGLWIKSVNISILKPNKKKQKKIWISKKFCEDKKLHFCDTEGSLLSSCPTQV
jgi:hypothetical protein